MRRVGKGFSGRDTPLFPIMVVKNQAEMGEDEALYEEMDDSLVRATTTATGLDAEQDRVNINKTQSKATPNEPSSLGTSLGGGPRRQDTMGDTIAQTGFENVSKTSNDSLLAGVNTPRSDEDRLKLNELMEFCTKLSVRVISSDEASLGDQEDASKQGRKIDDIDKYAEITLVHETLGSYGDEEMFDTGVLDGDEVLAEPEVTIKDVNLSVDEVTLAQAVAVLKTVNTRPKAKGLVIHEEEQATTLIISSQQPSHVKAHDKGKGIMLKKKKKKVLAEKSSYEIKEANIVAWDNVQAMIDVDYQMAQQMQAEEQDKLSIKEKSELFVQLLEARKKHFAAMRAQEERNKPPTKAQKRNTMSTYLKKHGWIQTQSVEEQKL
ncbi:hypothetical protein Tco_1465110 [Tanacetum coccineum]